VLNIDNVSSVSLEKFQNSALATELNSVRRLSRNQELISRVFSAINNYIRVRLGNNMPSQNDLEQMVADAASSEE